nr:endocuticle structural glycoprotein SgAbd-1-like [Penaeus vannamei]
MRLIVVAAVCALSVARPKVPSKSQLIYVPEYHQDAEKEAPEAPPRQEYERTPLPPLPQDSRREAFPSPSKAAPEIVPILKDLRASPERGVYNMAIETGNGIKVLQQVAGDAQGSKTKGAYYFTHPDGTVHKVTYVADENGFRPSSDLLPSPPRTPTPSPPRPGPDREGAHRGRAQADRGREAVRGPRAGVCGGCGAGGESLRGGGGGV